MPLSADSVFIGVFQRLNEDATLQGSSYLNDTGNVYLTPVRPDGAGLPALCLDFRGSDFFDEQKGMGEWLLLVKLYTQKMSNGEPDSAKAQLIRERVTALLDDADFSATGVTRIIIKKTTPDSSARLDPSANDEHFWISQYRVIAKSA